MGKMLARAFLCALAGLVGWILTEPFLPKTVNADWSAAEFRMVFLTLLLISLAAGFHQGYMKTGIRNIFFGSALGAVFGLIGGVLGYQFGGGISGGVYGPAWTQLVPFPLIIVPRTITFSFLGAFLGAGIGLTQFRTRILIAGAFGGLIGGGIAGLTFDVVGMATSPLMKAAGLFDPGAAEQGAPGRAIMFPLIGFTVGLFTAWLEQATRQAWVRLVLGRNEGREWPIDAAQTHIGRDERAQVPLFGDNNVAPLHATIVRQGHQYILHDAGTPLGVGYQGVRMMQPVALQPGDTFQVGAHQLQFLVKGTAARRITEGRAQAVPMGYGQPQMQPGQPAQPMQTVQPITPIQQSYPTVAQAPISNPTVAQAAVSGFAVVAIDGPITGQRFPVSHAIEVGREAQGINLSFDAQSSRKHALLSPGPQGVIVKDLGSTNGTHLNGQRIPEAVAPVGSVIRIGATSFRVESA
ncbi:MAG: FHA domain-containing protein [Fimbriimonadaceae bacterium]|nr:MAG: FHA domain-containing protein [Fimbriimonadaceae bacterium]